MDVVRIIQMVEHRKRKISTTNGPCLLYFVGNINTRTDYNTFVVLKLRLYINNFKPRYHKE